MEVRRTRTLSPPLIKGGCRVYDTYKASQVLRQVVCDVCKYTSDVSAEVNFSVFRSQNCNNRRPRAPLFFWTDSSTRKRSTGIHGRRTLPSFPRKT